ncbi:unnamed protein product [Closterium sp. Naga37s-1]|nr:unnamed protein product [Closterium sp. Naga37s-1]
MPFRPGPLRISRRRDCAVATRGFRRRDRRVASHSSRRRICADADCPSRRRDHSVAACPSRRRDHAVAACPSRRRDPAVAACPSRRRDHAVVACPSHRREYPVAACLSRCRDRTVAAHPFRRRNCAVAACGSRRRDRIVAAHPSRRRTRSVAASNSRRRDYPHFPPPHLPVPACVSRRRSCAVAAGGSHRRDCPPPPPPPSPSPPSPLISRRRVCTVAACYSRRCDSTVTARISRRCGLPDDAPNLELAATPALQAAADATFLHDHREYLIRKATHEVAVHNYEFATSDRANRLAMLADYNTAMALHIPNSIAWAAADNHACTILLGALPDTLMHRFQAREMRASLIWAELQSMFERRDISSVGVVFQEYFSIALATCDGAVDYVGRMQEVADRLAACQAALFEPLQIHRLLFNLTPDYESRLHAFTEANSLAGLNEVVQWIIDTEVKLRTPIVKLTTPQSSSSTSLNATQPRNQGGRNSGGGGRGGGGGGGGRGGRGGGGGGTTPGCPAGAGGACP